MTGGDDDAGSQPLDVPLPWPRQGFVEIVDVEEDVALRRGETAEIHEMGVAAGLHAKTGRRCRGQIRRHDRGRAAVEGERRLRHPPEAIGISSGIRPSLDSRKSSIGSRRSLAGFHPPCAARGVASRSTFPAARFSSADLYPPGEPTASFVGSCFAFVLSMLALLVRHDAVSGGTSGARRGASQRRLPQAIREVGSRPEFTQSN